MYQNGQRLTAGLNIIDLTKLLVLFITKKITKSGLKIILSFRF